MATLDLYTSRQLYGVMYDRRNEVPASFFLDNFFPNGYQSTSEEIVFEEIDTQRKLAPFMLANEQGKPIYGRKGSQTRSFKPAYTKPKDAVRPSEMLKRQPGELLSAQLGGSGLSPQQRYDAEVVRITQFHRASIMNTWNWMAARAILDGMVTINYGRDAGAAHPSVVVNFGRADAHTVTLGAGSRWGEAGVSILDNIQAWADVMGAARFGGVPTRLIVGSAAWAVMRKDAELLKHMDLTVRGSNVNLERGLVMTSVEQPATYVGTLGAGLEVWVYTGTFQADDGTLVPVMNSKDVLLASPGVDGVKAFGAILDADADLNAIDIFTKMWREPDPSATFIMSQSAPLMIPANPNRTLKARVLA